MRSIFIIILLCLILPLVSAEQVFKQATPVTLKFTCTINDAIPSASATYNFTLNYPNGTTFLNNVAATALGQGAFSYDTNFPIVGTYTILEFCYDGSNSYSNAETIEVTATGVDLNAGTKTFVIFISLAIIILIFSFIFRNYIFSFISGLMFSVTGVYSMIYGFSMVSTYTRMASFVILGLGMMITIISAFELLEELSGGDSTNNIGDDDD